MHFAEWDKDMSDTYYLARFIEERDADSFQWMIDVLSELERKKISLGVVIVYDMLEDEFMCLSDGARSLYIDFADDENTKYNYFSSISDNDNDGYSFYGFFISDMNWNILTSEFKFVNKIEEKLPVVPLKQPALTSPDYMWNRDDGYDYPPSRGDSKAPKSNYKRASSRAISTEKSSYIKTTPSYLWKEDKISKEIIEKLNVFNTRRLEEYSDDVVLYLEWLMETTLVNNLIKWFQLSYNDGVERSLQWLNSWTVYDHIINSLTGQVELILDEYEQLRGEWMEWFFDNGSQKYKQDLSIIDLYIDESIQNLNNQIEQLT